MSRATPSWLAEFQARFGGVLRAALDRSSGTLSAAPRGYDPRLVEQARDARGLAVYNRQYWFRLFGVLQSALPLTARLLGLWTFNDYAARFLAARPPRSWDIDCAPDGFEDFLAGELEREAAPARAALVEAARLDAAWHAVARAPAVPPFQPTAEEAARLGQARLQRSPAVAFVVERWPLLALRRSLLGDRGESIIPLPPPLEAPQHWALLRGDAGLGQLPLEPREAELLALLDRLPVQDALAKLEAGCTPEERERLPAQTHAWLARSVRLGFWSGLA